MKKTSENEQIVVFIENEHGIAVGWTQKGTLVRCKDCIHHQPFPFSDEHICDVFDWKSEDKDFCSFAERRTE